MKKGGFCGFDYKQLGDPEVEKELKKLWLSFLVEADYRLARNYNIKNGEERAKVFVIHLMEEERGITDGLWRLPF